MRLGSEDAWWSDLHIRACKIPFLPPDGCSICLRRTAGEGEVVEPLIDRDGSCSTRLDPADPSMGLPW